MLRFLHRRERERERERERKKLQSSNTYWSYITSSIFSLTSFPISILGTDLIILPALSPTESGMKREGSEDSDRKLAIT